MKLGADGGIQVPQGLLRAADLGEKVEVRAEPGRLVVTAAESGGETRSGWADAAREMRVAGDDRLLQ
ncbi:MAG: AbrB/MazE/SpoVT family DNA-binding domain-containing protein [Holophagales bacterium]|nr:AbrB/MazE/SpoVT family DNA-binding domain-containing protein [Holophagales bacterium]MYF96960.1 AbrB/MazE/SpoVT family DNA-binding domain-containing protein [Holophagales bacterium]